MLLTAKSLTKDFYHLLPSTSSFFLLYYKGTLEGTFSLHLFTWPSLFFLESRSHISIILATQHPAQCQQCEKFCVLSKWMEHCNHALPKPGRLGRASCNTTNLCSKRVKMRSRMPYPLSAWDQTQKSIQLSMSHWNTSFPFSSLVLFNTMLNDASVLLVEVNTRHRRCW